MAMAAGFVSFVLICVMLGGCRAGDVCPPAMFIFGDSLTDTGNWGYLFPDPNYIAGSDIRRIPRLPFRASDGRLLIDFIAEAFGFPLFSAYYMNMKHNYKHGVNFAVSGATARNTSMDCPIYLSRQINNYMFFKANVESAAEAESAGDLPAKSSFTSGLYYIAIGINDFWQNYFHNNYTVSRMRSEVVPGAVEAVTKAIHDLYEHGARSFFVVNVPAVGCLPIFLSNFGSGRPSDYDRFGCSIPHNDAVRFYNTLLLQSLQRFRTLFPDAKFWHADFYSLHMDAVAHPSKYGLDLAGTTVACCGGGGRFGHPVGQCSLSTSPLCTNASAYVSWDGLHFTEGFNRQTALSFLKGCFVDPSFIITEQCHLSFGNF